MTGSRPKCIRLLCTDGHTNFNGQIPHLLPACLTCCVSACTAALHACPLATCQNRIVPPKTLGRGQRPNVPFPAHQLAESTQRLKTAISAHPRQQRPCARILAICKHQSPWWGLVPNSYPGHIIPCSTPSLILPFLYPCPHAPLPLTSGFVPMAQPQHLRPTMSPCLAMASSTPSLASSTPALYP